MFHTKNISGVSFGLQWSLQDIIDMSFWPAFNSSDNHLFQEAFLITC